MYSINVLLVTYNQEKLVGRAIESVMAQKDYGLNKLVILDDCSSDNNWDVIQNYQNKYPDNIVSYRNEENIGGKSLYENIWKLYTLRGDADMYCFAAGDDAVCEGWFRAIQGIITERNIDVRHKAVTIFGNSRIVFPNGDTRIETQADLVEKGLELMRLRVRGIPIGTCPMMTRTLMEKYQKPILDEGLCLAEAMFDNSKYYFCEEAYYCNCEGYEYHAGIGVSKSIASSNDYYKSLIHANEMCKQLYRLCVKDQYWMDYESNKLKFIMNPTIKQYLGMCSAYRKAFDWAYNKITIKEDLKWFLFDAMRPAVKKLLGMNKQNTEPQAISV